ncbi:glutathione S-transferase family protein [Vibrio coralliilyticus]|uniref:glutathione S-transferase family protein n=1 Tax=Vibrio TaxID=662 RepID=UPI0005078225|nr:MULTISPECIES: glutathione S-transferase family protein [Vibrio]KFI13160.1 glutathione S-transferase [Vibrio sp. B183]NOI17632.1 glutathione S-transferase family protein [Vibrio coralliilyticus]NOI74180.1 glutathione S-transferase family protein [Vibrio coralliilyticus]PAW04785.1 glutathione S-transferase family protein [Vibrio coralliilyticus]
MIKVVSFKICPFVQRVTAALEAKKIPYEIEYIDLKNKPQWFLDISPNGQVPVMVAENGTALFESDAIIEYIEDEFGPLEQGVTNEQRALDRAWSYLASKHYLVQCSTMRSADEATLTERVEKLAKAFAKAEKQLAGPFFKGDQMSNVDMAWLPLLHRAHIIKLRTCFDMLEGLPKVQAWQNKILESGLVEKTVAEDFEEAFTGFYLSDQTFLGKGEDCTASSGCGTDCC